MPAQVTVRRDRLCGQPHRALPSERFLLVGLSLSWRVLGCVRRAINTGHTNAADLVQNFEEVRRVAYITAAEFRTITSVLGKKLADVPDENGTTPRCGCYLR